MRNRLTSARRQRSGSARAAVKLRPGVRVREYLPKVVTMPCFLGADLVDHREAEPQPRRSRRPRQRKPALAAGALRQAEVRAAAAAAAARRGPSGPRCLKISSMLAERRGVVRRRRAATDCAGPCGGVGSAVAGAGFGAGCAAVAVDSPARARRRLSAAAPRAAFPAMARPIALSQPTHSVHAPFIGTHAGEKQGWPGRFCCYGRSR